MARTPARPDGAVFEGAGKMPAPSFCAGQRGAVEDVALADLDLVEPEGAHRLQQDAGARDDRRGAVGVQARAPRGARATVSAASRVSSARSSRG